MYFRAKITEPEQVVATWQNIMAELAEEGCLSHQQCQVKGCFTDAT